MGIVEVECPECGGTATIGIPNGQEVRGVASTPSALPADAGKDRVVACDLGHEVHVCFGR